MTDTYNKEIIANYDKHMSLQICVSNPELKKRYTELALAHNQQTENAGFDLITPVHTPCFSAQVTKIDFGVKCKATMVTDGGKFYRTGFYMYPRSSLSKTRLRLANSVGIIDAGYRGNLIGAFDALDDYAVQAGDRLVQVCAPGLVPIIVTVVDDLGDVTARGSCGFGSTGR
jgi:dUTP pyrophosphatase